MTNDQELEIYEVAQSYRHWPVEDQVGVSKAFDLMFDTIWDTAIKDAIKMGSTGILGALLRRR